MKKTRRNLTNPTARTAALNVVRERLQKAKDGLTGPDSVTASIELGKLAHAEAVLSSPPGIGAAYERECAALRAVGIPLQISEVEG